MEVVDLPEERQSTLIANDLGFDHPTRYAVQTKVAPVGHGGILVIFHDEEEGPLGPRRPVYGSVSLDGGESFSEPQRITGEEYTHVGFAALTTRDEDVVLAFTGRTEEMSVNGIFVQDGTWDGEDVQWQQAELATPADAEVDHKFASVAVDPLGGRHVICRAEVEYDPDCDVDEADCLQERRQIFYLEDSSGSWSFTRISEQWTSTVPELVLDDDGGRDGSGGRGRLWAAWHNEERATVPIGCMVADASLWTADLDSGEAELGRVPGSWAGEACDAEVKSAVLPSIAVDSAGLVHAVWCLADSGYDLEVLYAHQIDGDQWSEPEPMSGATVRYGAVLTIGEDDVPVAYAPRNGDPAGQVVAFRREPAGWTEAVIDRSDVHGFNWVNPSMAPLTGGRVGLVYGREAAEGETGAVFFIAEP